MFNNKSILITGGTGSFGKEFIDTVLKNYSPKKLIIYSRDELKQFQMQNLLALDKQFKKLRFFIGDVRDYSRLLTAMENVDIVVHAAALKQVMTAEYNPWEAIKTNIYGAQNVIEASLKCRVKKIIALSTDKAAAPINLYGATKLTSDKLFLSANNVRGSKNTKFSVVRYGNVMSSRGSVIPFFFEQKKKGFIPITDKEMTRFNITLDQGVKFVIKCFRVMNGGELFIPKIPSIKITELADAIAPSLPKKIIGIRPGEKIHEEMITETDSLLAYEFKDYYVIISDNNLFSSNNMAKLMVSKGGKKCRKGFSYKSNTNKNFLSISQIKKILKIK